MPTHRFQLLRYVPDTVKDEFVNIGVVVLDDRGRARGTRMAAEDDLRRVRCLNPGADLDLLRSFSAELAASLDNEPEGAEQRLASLVEGGALSLRLEPARGCEAAQETGSILQILYESFVASPPRLSSSSVRRGTAAWVKHEADAVLRAERLLEHLDSGIYAQRFTFPGDPFRIHYGYRNGSPHYIHVLSLQYSVQQAKVLAFTFDRARAAGEPDARLTALVEPDPPASPTVGFTRRLLEESDVRVMGVDHIQSLVREVKQDLRIQ